MRRGRGRSCFFLEHGTSLYDGALRLNWASKLISLVDWSIVVGVDR